MWLGIAVACSIMHAHPRALLAGRDALLKTLAVLTSDRDEDRRMARDVHNLGVRAYVGVLQLLPDRHSDTFRAAVAPQRMHACA
jgi:hypothetical protein